VGQKQGETVCCAGVTADHRWVRQFPIHFRRLEDKFGRWNWIEYDWIPARDDPRPESQRVQEDTIEIVATMPPRERAGFLAPLVLPSTEAAAAQGKTLTLIRPKNVRFSWVRKSTTEVAREREAYAAAASQGSFFDEALEALDPCPYKFRFLYATEDGREHEATCDDWESAATYFKYSSAGDDEEGLRRLAEMYGGRYVEKGMVFAMGTHSRRPEQWLLVGVIRLDEMPQADLFR
jgi:hypothetical protein